MKNKILTLLLSLAISFGLWLYVVTVVSPESEITFYGVSVELKNTNYLDNNDWIIVSDTANLKIDLTLKGNRSDLSKLSSSNITITADTAKITGAGTYQLDCTVSLSSGSAAEVVSMSTETVTVEVVKRVSKSVKVEIFYTGTDDVPEGYEPDMDSAKLAHESITVKGPQEEIDKIAYAGIEVDLAGKKAGFVNTYALTLYGSNGQPLASSQYVTMSDTETSMSMQVNKVKKVGLVLELDYTGSGLQEGMVTVVLNHEEVTLLGTDTELESVGDTLTVKLALSKYSETTTDTLSLVSSLPSGVQCKETIQAEIKIEGLTSKTVKLSPDQFELKNLPEGMTAENIHVAAMVEITVWGAQEVLDKLTAEDICAVVDCSNVTADSVAASASYSIEGYEYLRIDGTNVSIVVTEPEG